MSDTEERDVEVLPIDSVALWEGCILASCVHSVMLTEYPFTLREHAWSGELYMTETSEGKAALVFDEKKGLVLGMFCLYASERNGLVITEQYAGSHYREAPSDIQEMALMLSQLFEEGEEEKKLPYVTTGFWQEDGQILSRDDEEDWLIHGGRILERQMATFEESMPYYEEICSMDERRVEIAERIYRERIASHEGSVMLTKEEIEVLREAGPYNMEICQETFEQCGVVFEA